MKKVILMIGAAVLMATAVLAMSVSAQDEAAVPEEDFFEMPGAEEAYRDAPPPQGRPFRYVQQIKEELGLTDEQEARLEELRLAHMKEGIELRAKMKVAGLELAELMKAHGNDQAVRQKSTEIFALRNQMAEMFVNHRLERRAVFTAEQWDEVSKLQRYGRYMRGRRGTGMHNRGFRGDTRFHRNRPAMRDGWRGASQYTK